MTRYTCPHYLARSGVCNDPALIEEPAGGWHAVSQPTLEIGGVVNPHGVIGGLRASGMRIEQIAIDRVDAKGSLHYGVTAWRLMQHAMPQEATKSACQGRNAIYKP